MSVDMIFAAVLIMGLIGCTALVVLLMNERLKLLDARATLLEGKVDREATEAKHLRARVNDLEQIVSKKVKRNEAK